jgi:hypothetical protein
LTPSGRTKEKKQEELFGRKNVVNKTIFGGEIFLPPFILR